MALAEAAGYEPQPLQLQAKAPWRWLPEFAWPLWGTAPKRLSAANQQALAANWPDLVVACGRLSVPLAIHIKRASAGRTFVVQCQDPRVSPHLFDMVVPPEHDMMVPADNVVPVIGSPNLALPWRLEAAAHDWQDTFAPMAKPLIAVAIGGPSKAYDMSGEDIEAIFACLGEMQERSGGSLAITTSRRTGAHNETRIRTHADRLGAWLWDGTGPSPILGLYALADAIVVTADSVNMAAEAAASGKPLFIAPLEGGSEKFDHFHDMLRARNIARVLSPQLENWTYTPLDETRRAASEIRKRMAERGFNLPPAR